MKLAKNILLNLEEKSGRPWLWMGREAGGTRSQHLVGKHFLDQERQEDGHAKHDGGNLQNKSLPRGWTKKRKAPWFF